VVVSLLLRLHRDAVSLVFVDNEKGLSCFEVQALQHLDLGFDMSEQSQVLLLCRLEKLGGKLSGVTRQVLFVLESFLEALLGTLAILLHYLEESLVGVEEKLIFLQVDVLGGDGVFAKVSPHKDAETVLAYHRVV